MKYGYELMTFDELILIVDGAATALEEGARREQELMNQVEALQRLVIELERQLKTAHSVMFTDEFQTEQLQASIERLGNLILKK